VLAGVRGRTDEPPVNDDTQGVNPMIRPSWIEMLVSSRMRVLAPLAAATGMIGLKGAAALAQSTPTATAAPEALLLRAIFKMQDVTSYRFDLALEQGQIEVIPEVFKIDALEGEVVRPDSFRANTNIELVFIDVRLEIVSIGNDTWITNPLVLAGGDDDLVRVGDLGLVDGFDPADAVNPDQIALPLLPLIEQAVTLGEETIDGIATTSIEGVIGREGIDRLGDIFGDAAISAALNDDLTMLPVTVWIDGEDYVRRLEVRGPIFLQESDQLRRRFTFRDFDSLITIERPQ
jgi:hypothetical protein